MFDTPALMRALEEFKVSANKPLPPMSDRLLEEAWHGSIMHDTVRTAEADSSDDEADEEISVDSEDGAESSDDDNSDDEANAPVPDEEESEDEDEVRVFSSSSDILP